MGKGGNSIERKLDTIAKIIDAAFDTRSSEGTNQAFKLIHNLETLDLAPRQDCLLHYYKANAWENRFHENGKTQTWDWEIPETQNQIVELRKCIIGKGFQSLSKLRRCQILTNFGNKLNAVGRCIEAIEQWDKAITIDKKFAMALGNRGQGLTYYARSLYDSGHSEIILLAASESYQKAANFKSNFDNPDNEQHRETFKVEAEKLIAELDVEQTRDLLDGYKRGLGSTECEKDYRNWVLCNRLFINPLNDLGHLPIASHDVLTLPSITTEIEHGNGNPPAIIGFYNQLKQEYVSARYLFYEALQSDEGHFSDKDVLLYNTLDYPSYGLACEKIRTALRIAYSLFDKTAYFINHYFDLGHPDRFVNFRNVWYDRKSKGSKVLHPELQERTNWSLRGLFWLSKDIYEGGFKDVTELDARELYDIRNHLEHKYLQILDSSFGVTVDSEDHTNDFGYKITSKDFTAKTIRMLKLARACLIYLSLAIYREEQCRHADKDGTLVAPIFLDTWDDDWKT